ncbi:hypothetical protein ACFSM5_13370 [Lacibacterium aquatile]|uniref:Uncharacterized protein n=1 Tax=Lacibacterium aquatile TaxID=1168082 RepID=A0ABW5DWS7_9PROT
MKLPPLILASALLALPAAAQSKLPFVGCPADGQTGPIDGPSAMANLPDVPAEMVEKLAYYATTNVGVLAPRGWSCFGLNGSNGAILLVTPTPIKDPFGTQVSGPVVQVSRTPGTAAGRIDVAEVAARLFPVAADFVKSAAAASEAEGLKVTLPTGPYPKDRLNRRSDTIVEFITPGNEVGQGTAGRIVKSADPILGAAVLLPNENMNLIQVQVRLPADLRDLAPTIVVTVETNLAAGGG